MTIATFDLLDLSMVLVIALVVIGIWRIHKDAKLARKHWPDDEMKP